MLRFLRWLQSIDRPLDLNAVRSLRLFFAAPLCSFWLLILLGEDFLMAMAYVGAGVMVMCSLFVLWAQFAPVEKPKNEESE